MSKKSSSSKKHRSGNIHSRKRAVPSTETAPGSAHVPHERPSDILADGLRRDRDSLDSIREEGLGSIFGRGKYPL